MEENRSPGEKKQIRRFRILIYVALTLITLAIAILVIFRSALLDFPMFTRPILSKAVTILPSVYIVFLEILAIAAIIRSSRWWATTSKTGIYAIIRRKTYLLIVSLVTLILLVPLLLWAGIVADPETDPYLNLGMLCSPSFFLSPPSFLLFCII